MKNIKLCAILLSLALGCTQLSSCKDENDDEPGAGINKELLQKLQSTGWRCDDEPEISEWGSDGETSITTRYTKIIFTTETSGAVRYFEKEDDSYFGIEIYESGVGFTYQIQGNTILLEYMGSPDWPSSTLKWVNGVIFDEKNNDIYSASAITSSDLASISKYEVKSGKCGDNITWRYYNERLTLEGSGKMYDYTETNHAPWYDLNVTYIEFDGNVTHIGNYAFKDANITDIETESSITSIGDYAFAGCSEAEDIEIESSITSIGDYAFAGCSKAEYLDIRTYNSDSQLTHIGKGAFYGCRSLQIDDINYCKNLKYIDDYAFVGCKIDDWEPSSETLEYIGTGDNNYLGLYVIGDYDGGTVKIPNSVKNIGKYYPIYGNINNIWIGSGLTKIPEKAIMTFEEYGTIYVNNSTPPIMNDYIVADPDTWTLYVPKGCKSKYANATGWRYFGEIKEDNSLDGGKSNSVTGNNSLNDNDWKSLGYGYFMDSFVLGNGVYEVEILKAEGEERYRVMAPYDEGHASDAGEWADWLTGSYPEYLEFWTAEDGSTIMWDGVALGINYEGSASQPIYAYPAYYFNGLSQAGSSYWYQPGYAILGVLYYVPALSRGWNYTSQPVIQIRLPE